MQPVALNSSGKTGYPHKFAYPRAGGFPLTLAPAPNPAPPRLAGLMNVRSYPNRGAMGDAAAKDIATALRQTLAVQAQVRMIFAAAPSQAQMLASLAAAEGIDWTRVTAFHMDEYIGLAPTRPSALPTGSMPICFRACPSPKCTTSFRAPSQRP